MEYLDIRDKNGNPTGVIKERSLVHADGDLHGTSHVWIVKKNEKGSYDLLLQKRSENKDAFPGCYDISSAGHLPAGQDYLTSALRELEEELGIKAWAPYPCGQADLLTNEILNEGVRIPVKEKKAEQRKSDSAYERLLRAGRHLLDVIAGNRGLSNKDAARFESQIQNLAEKWDRKK